MASNGDNLSEVTIGSVTGGIHNSVIAGRDVKNVTITLGGQETPADKEPSQAELKHECRAMELIGCAIDALTVLGESVGYNLGS